LGHDKNEEIETSMSCRRVNFVKPSKTEHAPHWSILEFLLNSLISNLTGLPSYQRSDAREIPPDNLENGRNSIFEAKRTGACRSAAKVTS